MRAMGSLGATSLQIGSWVLAETAGCCGRCLSPQPASQCEHGRHWSGCSGRWRTDSPSSTSATVACCVAPGPAGRWSGRGRTWRSGSANASLRCRPSCCAVADGARESARASRSSQRAAAARYARRRRLRWVLRCADGAREWQRVRRMLGRSLPSGSYSTACTPPARTSARSALAKWHSYLPSIFRTGISLREISQGGTSEDDDTLKPIQLNLQTAHSFNVASPSLPCVVRSLSANSPPVLDMLRCA